MKETIGDWSSIRLSRYILNILRDAPARIPQSLGFSRLTVSEKLIVEDELELSPQAIQYLKDKLGLP